MKPKVLYLVLLLTLMGTLKAHALDKDWTYIPIDDAKQKWGDWDQPEWLRYFGIDFGDVDRDGNIDIVSGRYVYHNPGGTMEEPWSRTVLDDNVDAIFAIDADGDPFADIIAQALPNIYWYEAINQAGTRYTRKVIANIPATGHVNSQGFEKAQIVAGGKLELVIASNGNIYCITIPENTDTTEKWPTYLIAKNTSDEGIGIGDIDGDGDLDIACGRRPEDEGEPLILVWYENPGSLEKPWQENVIGRTDKPIDRVELGDLDGDGHLEIVISEERYPGLEPDGKLLWFSRKDSIHKTWDKHCIVTQYSMNNLDLADIDKDGDIDIITNEHKGPNLETQLWINNGRAQFTKRILDTGKENHLGTQFCDLDGDGDLDVAGCAWDNYRWMHVWRNDEVKPLTEGSVFREYRWAAKSVANEAFLRVGGSMGYQTHAEQFPPENMRDGFIHLTDKVDLKGATHAELVIEKLQCHEDTKELRIKINDNDWILVHEPHTIPAPATNYMFYFYPRVNVPLAYLQGDKIEFKMKVHEHQKWNWPQNLIYGLILRVYYESDKNKVKAKVAGIADNGVLSKKQGLSLRSKRQRRIAKVDYFGFYEDINWSGDGIYQQWQYHTHETEIRNHIGSSSTAPFAVDWDTQWLPDQDKPMKVLARVELKNGLTFLTNAVEGLSLNREYSVELVKPYGQPAYWSTRSDVFSEYLHLDADAERAKEAKLYWRSWSPCYAAGITLNGQQILGDGKKLGWPCYAYYEHRYTLRDPSILRQGVNVLTTLKSPLHDGHMVHGMEVQWPAIMMKVKLKKAKPALQVAQTVYEEKPHFIVHTKAATYYYDIQGGGLSRIIDAYGNDWVSFKRNPWGQYPASAASAFRGLPNSVWQGADDGAGHPGHAKCTSRVEGKRIVTESLSGKWRWTWEFFDNHAVLDITKTDTERKYWFLYEGTPGGVFKPADSYFGTDQGGPSTKQPDFYKGPVMGGQFQWMYAGNKNTDTVFYMAQLQQDNLTDVISYLGNSDKGVQSEDGMTVFGFGRTTDTKPLLSGPHQFVIGFYPDKITNESQHAEFANYMNQTFIKE